MRSGKTYSAWRGAELSKIQRGKSGSPQTEHCEVENAAWTLRNRRRNKALTARQSESGGEIDLEGSAACDRLRFTGTVGEAEMARQRAKTRLSAPDTPDEMFPQVLKHRLGRENDDESVLGTRLARQVESFPNLLDFFYSSIWE